MFLELLNSHMLISEILTINLGKRPQRREGQIRSTPIADQLKRERVIRKLTKQFNRRGNVHQPTNDEIRVAKDRAETTQKRVDLEYDKQAKLAQQIYDAHRH